MAKINQTPKIRFKGFIDAWEQRKLGDIADVTKLAGFEFTEHIVYSDEGNIIALRGLNVKNGQLILDDVKYIDGSNFSKLGRSKLYKNDVLFTYVGTVGELAIIPENDRFYLAPNVSRIRFQKDYDARFMIQEMGNKSFYKNMIFPLIATSSQPALSMENIRKFVVSVPSDFDEQQEIGRYFSKLDNLITLHQRKLLKTQNFKKAMLEKMFPKNGESVPEIRFAGFTDPWEQRKLGEVATFINGRAYSQPELLSEGKYKVLRVGNFYTNDSWYYSDLELGEKYYANYGDLLYTWSATFGPHIWLGDKVIYHYHIWKVELSEQLEKHFAVQLLEQDKANILSSKNGSTMVHITKEGMEDKDVIIPSDASEQKQIGAFFGQLDNLITLHQRKLEKLQNIKKSLLAKMFV